MRLDTLYIPIFLACKCNGFGTVAKKDLMYIRNQENDLCNAESCQCTDGYTDNDCNSCENGYYIEETVSGENKCSGN